MTSFTVDPSKAKPTNVSNPYDFQGVSVSACLMLMQIFVQSCRPSLLPRHTNVVQLARAPKFQALPNVSAPR